MKRFIIFLFLLSLYPISLISAQNVIVKAELDSMMMWVGQQTGLHVEVTCDAGKAVSFPAYRDTIVKVLRLFRRLLPIPNTSTQTSGWSFHATIP